MSVGSSSTVPPSIRSEPTEVVSEEVRLPTLKKWFNVIKSFLIREKLLTILLILYLIICLLTLGRTLNPPKYVDFRTIALITSLLLVSRGIEASGIFTLLSIKMVTLSRGSLPTLFTFVILLTAASAALVMNDTSLFIYVPLVITLSRVLGVDRALLATLVTIAANVGSSLTPIGNPQNIIIWQHYGVSFYGFIIKLLPFTALGMTILITYSLILSKRLCVRRYSLTVPPGVRINYPLLITSSPLLVANLLFAHLGMHYFALLVTALSLLAIRREVVLRTDYPLILIFILMFADFRGIASLIRFNYPLLGSALGIVVISSLLSQLVSNVPATILLIDSVSRWGTLAVGVNLGGTGFILGSLANVITIRLGGVSLKDFHRYELPYFLVLMGATLSLVGTHVYVP